MKNCPKCNELIGDNVNRCFKCGYDFLKKKEEDEKRKEDDEKRNQERNQEIKNSNHIYEYKVVKITDSTDGRIDSDVLQKTLDLLSEDAWRLVHAFTNEIGKESSTIGAWGMAENVNHTIDETILIFERRIR